MAETQTRYTVTLAAFDLEQLDGEVQVLALPGFVGMSASSASQIVQAIYSAPLTDQQVATLSATMAAHVPDPTAPAKRLRAQAQAILSSSPDPLAKLMRAVALTVLDSLNQVRQSPTTTLPAITPAQMVSAIAAKITSGAAD